MYALCAEMIPLLFPPLIVMIAMMIVARGGLDSANTLFSAAKTSTLASTTFDEVVSLDQIETLGKTRKISVFREQMKGHHLYAALLNRQEAVGNVMQTDPLYFPQLADFGLENDLLTSDHAKQLRELGNCTHLAKMEAEIKDRVGKPAANIEKRNKILNNAIKKLENNIAASQNPQAIQKLQKILEEKITERNTTSSDVQQETSTEALNLLKQFRALRDKTDPCVVEMQHAVKKVNDQIRIHSKGGDGNFEKRLRNELKPQWYGKICSQIIERHPGVQVDDIEILANGYCVVVVKNTNGKIRPLQPAEIDLILYHEETKQIFAVGEIKSNYYDVPHADYQLRRDWVMLTGMCPPTVSHSQPTWALAWAWACSWAWSWVSPFRATRASTSAEEAPTATTDTDFQLYTESNVVDRFIACEGEKLRSPYDKNAFLTQEDWQDPIRFILTQPPKRNGLEVTSKVATQVAQYLFSASTASPEYIQQKVDDYINGMGFRDGKVIYEENFVYEVKA